MLIEGSKILPLPREQVWRALNDASFLQATVPGCRRVSAPREDALLMELTSSVGPIKVNFTADVKKLDVRAPESFVLEGGGSGGPAGSATGRLQIRLAEVPGGTQLDYSAQTEVTGRIAQLGARLIDSTARRFSEEFFANAARALSNGEQATPATVAAPATPAAPAPASASTAGSPDLRLALDGLAWRVALACGLGSGIGALVANLLVRSGP